MSKHGAIINYINHLKVGTRISVRGIASALNVSEGTAYRAIKQCGEMGIIATIPRVGTIRVDKVDKKSAECLTYAQVINIVDGTILGGHKGVYKTLNKFFIAAMTEEDAVKFFEKGSLIIVGNRDEIQKLALEKNCGVLISGGFKCNEDIKNLADEKCLPVISSDYDTFTIASMMNKAISENIIKKEIILIEDVLKEDFKYIKLGDKIKTLKELCKSKNYKCYPIANDDYKFLGNVYYKDIKDKDDEEVIHADVIKHSISIEAKTTIPYAGHLMLNEDINVCAVTDKKKLLGIISKAEIINAIKYISLNRRSTKNIENSIMSNFDYEQIAANKMHFFGKILPQMLDIFGNASCGILSMIMQTSAILNVSYKNDANVFIDSISTYFIEPVQVNSYIDIFTEIIDKTKNSRKIEVDIYNKNKNIVCKALLSAKILF